MCAAHPFIHISHVLVSAATPSPSYVVHACVPTHTHSPIHMLQLFLTYFFPSSHIPRPFPGLASCAMAPFHTSCMAPTHCHAHCLRLCLAMHPMLCHTGRVLPCISAIIHALKPLPCCSNMPMPNPCCLAHLLVILSHHSEARQSHRLILQRTWSCLCHTTGMDEVQSSRFMYMLAHMPIQRHIRMHYRHTHQHVKTCTHAACKLCRHACPHVHECIDQQ